MSLHSVVLVGCDEEVALSDLIEELIQLQMAFESEGINGDNVAISTSADFELQAIYSRDNVE